MSNKLKALILKDIKEVTGSSQMLLPLLIVPLIMMIILPTILLVGAQFGVSGINGMDLMMKNLSGRVSALNQAQLMIELGVNYMFPSLFLVIPIMASSIIGASSFVGEKERKTLESLLYTPVSIRELFAAKVYGPAILAYLVALVSVAVFGIVVNVGGWFYFEKLIFPNVKWILVIFWLAPAITILGVSFMVLVSAKAKTYQEAQQMSAFIIIPVLLMLIGQATGLFLLNELILILVGLVVYVIDFVLIRTASGRFIPEKLL